MTSSLIEAYDRGFYEKIVVIAVAVIVLVSGIIFVPRLSHKRDDCGNVFIGTGYKANVVSDFFSKDEQIICRECAETQHALSIALGKSVEDFKRELFD